MSTSTYHHPTLGDLAREGGERAPWLLCSMAAHAVLFFILSLVVFDRPLEQPCEIIAGGVVEEPLPVLIDPVDREPDTDSLDPEQVPEPEEPVIADEIDDRNRTDDDQPYDATDGQDQLTERLANRLESGGRACLRSS